MKRPLRNFRLALALAGLRSNLRLRILQAFVIILYLVLFTVLLSSCQTKCPAYSTKRKATFFEKQEAKLENYRFHHQ